MCNGFVEMFVRRGAARVRNTRLLERRDLRLALSLLTNSNESQSVFFILAPQQHFNVLCLRFNASVGLLFHHVFQRSLVILVVGSGRKQLPEQQRGTANAEPIAGMYGWFVFFQESMCPSSNKNRREVLDPAFVRPGRFDRSTKVNLPDVHGRERILRLHAKKVPGFTERKGINDKRPGR